jgi:hypothetical protein
MIPVFAAIFMVWLYVVRPSDWPKSRADLNNPRAIAWPLLIFSVQLVLVAFCLAVGRGIGGLMDFQPPLPIFFSVLLSLLGVSVARLLQPKDASYIFRMPGQELGIGAGILDIGVPAMPGQSDEAAYIEGVMMHLADLGPKRAPRELIEEIVTAVAQDGMARPVLSALSSSRGDTVVQVQMQAMLALRPDVAGAVTGLGLIGKSITRALSTWVPQIIEDTARDALALIERMPGIVDELPSASRLEAAANAIGTGGSAAEALRLLSQRLSDAHAARAA